ncbi:HEAT repeat domain-containing protein [Methanogenium sp. S4BF]|uniref:HEAT repeat domain-containing protein n=1 Tax=Methanogenium sp. S4BF TaxID=1789226 RepID=UPI0024170E65|nr:HEAT repeat domain-containing protein [Methanogenium sp. S4BF]WFN34520.1 HEAT repeat domain-containing protein [Methanogenium sp. S4BF]
MPEKTYQRLIDQETNERCCVASELETYGKPALQYLVLALKDSDKWVRVVSADALGNIGDSGAVDALIEALGDSDQDVRFTATGALGKIGDPRAADSLRLVMETDHHFIASAAEDALEQMGQKY